MSRRVHAFSVLIALIALGAFAGVGFLVGRAGRTSLAQAAQVRTAAGSLAFQHARAAAYGRAWRQGYHRGWVHGLALGRKAGTLAGTAAGRAAAARRATALELIRRLVTVALSPVTLSRTTIRDKCVLVGGGLCEVLGPGATGKPCPPSSVPTPIGGVVCVPRLLLEGNPTTDVTALAP